MVLGGVGWDVKELPRSNLHVYDRDDTKIVIYSTRGWPEKSGDLKNQEILVISSINSCNLVKKEGIII